MSRKLSLNAFLHDTGHHEASWRHPDSAAERVCDIALLRRAGAASPRRPSSTRVFFADGPACGRRRRTAPDRAPRADHPAGRDRRAHRAHRSHRDGVVDVLRALQPGPAVLLARHPRGGRAGWNIVTTQSEQVARNFDLTQLPDARGAVRPGPGVRRRRHQAVGQLGGRRRADRPRERPLLRPGEGAPDRPPRPLLPGRGALAAPRSPQGRPVLVQAGSSNQGRSFAARNAEAIFTAHQTIEDAPGVLQRHQGPCRDVRAQPRPREDPARHQPVHRRHRGRGARAAGLRQLAHGAGVRTGPARGLRRHLAAPPRRSTRWCRSRFRQRRSRARQRPQPPAGGRQHRRAGTADAAAAAAPARAVPAGTTSSPGRRCRSPTSSPSGSRAAPLTAST